MQKQTKNETEIQEKTTERGRKERKERKRKKRKIKEEKGKKGKNRKGKRGKARKKIAVGRGSFCGGWRRNATGALASRCRCPNWTLQEWHLRHVRVGLCVTFVPYFGPVFSGGSSLDWPLRKGIRNPEHSHSCKSGGAQEPLQID